VPNNVLRSRDRLSKQVSIREKNDTKYQIVDNYYQWQASKGEIHLTVEFIDQLFFEYSEHGLNLSQTKIINKHDLKVWQWHSIKNTLQLYKQSHVFSPYTVENTPPEELQTLIQNKVGKVFSSVGYQVEDQYTKQLHQQYKKVINKQAKEDLIYTTFLTELQDFIPYLQQHQIVPTLKVNSETDLDAVAVFIFDVHYGAENRTKDLAPYSPEVVHDLFAQIAKEVNKLNAKEVHLFFGGDNIETFTGLNHPDSWKGIAKGYYGAQLVKRGYKALVQFISEVNNVKCIHAVPGNHDRATEDNKVDMEGYIAEILFELIDLSFQGKLEVNYNQKIISCKVDNINYLMSHGHLKLTDITPAELILKYGDPTVFNLLVSGHWHNRKIKKDNRRFRQVVCPSLFPGNDYSEGLGVDSLPGFLIVHKGLNDKILIHDYSL
jgi:predicted phosphodiesterase